ncbi:hypothetical protein Tco_0702525 [Tanacetum coccineum]|uniref:Uncharacterized protein n=1 Tax=Tanacetum coccineum TaxID=301880 RepID=A0ABQ4XW85_9ASTR
MTKSLRRWMKCLKGLELSFEDKWLRVQQKCPVPLSGIKEILVRSGLEDKIKPETEMDQERRNRKRPYEGEGSSLTEELTFLAIPRNSLTDEPIILEGIIKGHQSFVDRFLKQDIPPLGCCDRTYRIPWGGSEDELIQYSLDNSWKETQWLQHMEQISRIQKQTILRARNNPGHRPGKEPMLPEKERGEGNMGEKVTICNKQLDQSITIESTLSLGCKLWLINILRKNVDVLAWAGPGGQ